MTTTTSHEALALNPGCRRRRSPNGINLVFIPGQNVVLELNAVAGQVLELLGQENRTAAQLREALALEYDIEDVDTFVQDVDQLLERLIRHEVVVAADEKADRKSDGEGDRS